MSSLVRTLSVRQLTPLPLSQALHQLHPSDSASPYSATACLPPKSPLFPPNFSTTSSNSPVPTTRTRGKQPPLPIFSSDLFPAATSLLYAAKKFTDLSLTDFHHTPALRIFSALPPTLICLELEIDGYLDDRLFDWTTLDAICLGMSATPRLRSLCLGRSDVADWDYLEGWLELIKECARKQVELKFDSGPVDPGYVLSSLHHGARAVR